MATNIVYKKKKNKDGSDFIDPITNDFVNEIVSEEFVEDIVLSNEDLDRMLFDELKNTDYVFTKEAEFKKLNLAYEIPLSVLELRTAIRKKYKDLKIK